MHLVPFIRDDRGATAVEYVLLAAMFAIGVLIALSTLGTSVRESYDAFADEMADAGSP